MDGSNYISRYKRGEHEAVWREVACLDRRTLSEAVFSDVLAVAEEIVSRAYHNLRLLQDRLNLIGYQFESPDEVLVDANQKDLDAIFELEQSMGSLPLIARVWYQRIACIDFRQRQSQLFKPDSLPTSHNSTPVIGLGLHTPLVFWRIHKCMEWRERLVAQCQEAHVSANFLDRRFTTGGCASNNDPKGFLLPSFEMDGVLYNSGAGDVRLVDELRLAMASGGFPFWRSKLQIKRAKALTGQASDFTGLLVSLRNDFLPL